MINIYKHKQKQYEVRIETHQNKEYLVVPVTMMVEGVHAGSHGPLLHTIEDLGMFPASWDGIPIVIDHPQNSDGGYISANSPQVIDSVMVGRVYNTHVDGKSLKAEAWLDKKNLENISIEVLTGINEKNTIEVSVGVFTEDKETTGTYNGKDYTAIAKNHRPDHLALLPGGVGACSVDDGCGIRANSVNDKKKGVQNVEVISNAGGHSGHQGEHSGHGGGGSSEIKRSPDKKFANEDKYTKSAENHFKNMNTVDEIGAEVDKLHEQKDILRGRLNDIRREGGLPGVEEKLSSQILDIQDRISIGTELLKKQAWSEKTNNNSMQRTKFNINKKEVKNMEDNTKDCDGCMEKIVKIINSNQTHFTSKDREWLLAQEETLLDKLMPREVELDVNAKEKMECPKCGAMITIPNAPATNTEQVQTLSAEDKAALEYGKKQLAANRKQLIDNIQANTDEGTWPITELTVMSIDTLERINKSIKKIENVEHNDYSLQANNVQRVLSNAGMDDYLLPTGVELEIKK